MIDNEFVTKRVDADMSGLFPAGKEMQSQVSGRRRRGTFFRWLFLWATLVAIVVLMILLLSIINQSFGYVIEQVNVPEEALVTAYNKTRIMEASNVILASENDQELADGIATDPYGTGFFGFAFYADNQDKLTALSIGGVLPTEEDVLSGDYPGTRPLFIYSAAEVLQQKPQVAAFIEFYMQNLDLVADVGYFQPLRKTWPRSVPKYWRRWALLSCLRLIRRSSKARSEFQAVRPCSLLLQPLPDGLKKVVSAAILSLRAREQAPASMLSARVRKT